MCFPLVIALALTLLAVPARAQTPCKEIDVASEDNPLNITGFLGLGQEDTFVDNLRLSTPCEGGVERFKFLPPDLKREGGTTEIGRQNVAFVGEPTLEANDPKDFQVKVSGVTVPGTYTGTIHLLLPGQTLAEAQTVDMQLVAKVQPELTRVPSTGLVQLRLVNCSGFPDCSIASLVFNKSAFLEETTVRFNNPAQAPVKVTAAKSVVVEENQYQLTDEQLGLPQGEHTFPPQQVSGIPLTIERQGIPAGHYTGSIYLTLEDATQQMQVPVDLSVRIGPFVPLLLLLVGIILGQLVKYMQERGNPQSKMLDEIDRLDARILQEANPEDQRILIPMVRSLRQAVYRGESLETVGAKLKEVEKRLEALEEVRNVEEMVIPYRHDPAIGSEVEDVLDDISLVRSMYEAKRDQDAQNLWKSGKVEALLAKLPSRPDAPERSLRPAILAAQDAVERAAQPEPAEAGGTGWLEQRKQEWDTKWKSKKWYVKLYGLLGMLRAEITRHLLRPLLKAALLLGLLLVGLDSLYVNKGLTFGTHPFADYLSLVLWGLGSDVASRSLANLRDGSVQT